MKQLVHIHGGEAFETHDAYITYLREFEIDEPGMGAPLKWRDTYAPVLGDDWQIIMPRMPNAMNAKYFEWALWFQKYLPYLKDGVVFVGHSLGAKFLAKFLAENELPVQTGQVHLVSGSFGYVGGFELPDDISGITSQCNKVVIYHAMDDDIVPYADAEQYHAALSEAQLMTFDDRGHFLQAEFPELMMNIQS